MPGYSYYNYYVGTSRLYDLIEADGYYNNMELSRGSTSHYWYAGGQTNSYAFYFHDEEGVYEDDSEGEYYTNNEYIPQYNNNNPWETSYALGSYYEQSGHSFNAIKKHQYLGYYISSYTTRLASTAGSWRIKWNSGNTFYIYSGSISISGTNVSSWGTYVTSFTVYGHRIVFFLQAGGGGGGAPYSGHDGAGGGAGGCAIFVLNLEKLISNSGSWYEISLGAAGGRSGSGWGSQGGTGGFSALQYCYMAGTSSQAINIACATGGTGGVNGTGGAGGYGYVSTSAWNNYVYAYAGTGCICSEPSTYSPSQWPSISCYRFTQAKSGRPMGNAGYSASVTVYSGWKRDGSGYYTTYSRTSSGSGGGSANSNSGGGGGGSYIGGAGGKGGSATAEAGSNGTMGAGGGGARYTWGGKEGGAGGPGCWKFYGS